MKKKFVSVLLALTMSTTLSAGLTLSLIHISPDFELPDQNGNMHKLSDYAGKKVILYFYPKDNTAGCTKPVSYTHLNLPLWQAHLREIPW